MLNITLPLFYAEQLTGSEDTEPATEEALAFFTGVLASEKRAAYFFIKRQTVVTDIVRDIVWLN
jgi:hypothetical protein